MTPAAQCFNQIKSMDGYVMYDWGTIRNHATISSDGLTLTLKSGGRVPWKGFIAISYNEGSDLYDVEFFRVCKPRKTKLNPFPAPEKKVVSTSNGVYFDMLIAAIDRQVLKRG